LAESPTCDICEIFESPRFSSFSTQSARSGLSLTAIPVKLSFAASCWPKKIPSSQKHRCTDQFARAMGFAAL